MPGRVKCGGTEWEIVVAHGCRKRKKLICGTEGETVVAYGRLPSPRSFRCESENNIALKLQFYKKKSFSNLRKKVLWPKIIQFWSYTFKSQSFPWFPPMFAHFCTIPRKFIRKNECNKQNVTVRNYTFRKIYLMSGSV